MEKQTDRKIKVLHIDSVGEYKDQLLQFDQNTGIRIHFIYGIYGMAKKMNRSFLEKFSVYCLMHH